MLMGGSVVTSCSLHVLLSICGICPGLCARERATKTENVLPVSYVRTKRPHTEKPGKSSYPCPPGKNFESTPRELQCSDRAETSTTGSGRPSGDDVLRVLAKSARTKRYDPKTDENSIRGAGCFPRDDASWHATGEVINRHPAVLVA